MKNSENMQLNCIDVRRSILTEPKKRDKNLLDHLSACNACASFFGRHAVFEEQLAQSIEVDVPDNLEARILLAQKVGEKQVNKVQQRWFAIAASVVLSLAVLVSMLTLHRSPDIQSLVMEHMYHDHGQIGIQPFRLVELNAILGQHNIKMQREIGKVVYAKDCLVGDKLAAHIILVNNDELVTVLFLSNEKVNARLEFRDDQYHGVIMPTMQGSIAIISKRMPAVNDIEKKVMEVTTYDL